MKKIIYISDLVGIKSGMHYYHEAQIESLRGECSECVIKSNYTCVRGDSYYPNIFSGNIFFRLCKLVLAYCKFLQLCVRSRDAEVRHYWYGTWVDVPFILLAMPFKHVLFDIHEIVMLDYRGGYLVRLIERCFSWSRNQFVVHSDVNYQALAKVIKCDRISVVPHPELSPPTKYNIDNITDEYVSYISDMRAREMTICLFFGDLRPSKGIHEVLRLCENNYGDVSFLVCGQDIFGILPSKAAYRDHVLISPRRQSDEELAFLFSNSDIILLPYINSSQSGVLEVARAFGKPILVSPILAETMHSYEFPSESCDFNQSSRVIVGEIEKFSAIIPLRLRSAKDD